MFETFARRLMAWRQERIAIRKLELMDDHILIDMGTSRGTIREFVRRRTRC
jgi:uncharacterized protein YjiS (DUF1127 family)